MGEFAADSILLTCLCVMVYKPRRMRYRAITGTTTTPTHGADPITTRSVVTTYKRVSYAVVRVGEKERVVERRMFNG